MQKRICYNCFNESTDQSGRCPHCGYQPRQNRDKYPFALPEGTMLNGSYIVGSVQGYDHFCITYVAHGYWDKALVIVKEYYPDIMVVRTDGYSVSADLKQYAEDFAYGKDCFLEEVRALAKLRGNPNIFHEQGCFEENGTVYMIMDYVEGISFKKYLEDRGTAISWEETKRIFFSVMDAMLAVRAKGRILRDSVNQEQEIIFCDISPDNIFISRDGKIMLMELGIARCSLGDRSCSLDVTLEHGFAPIEQYTRHGSQGVYTEVYALASIMYYAITFRIPPTSIDRFEKDDLIKPSSFGVSIPPAEEMVLLKALAVRSRDRFQTVLEFYLMLKGEEISGRKEFDCGLYDTYLSDKSEATSVCETSVVTTIPTTPTTHVMAATENMLDIDYDKRAEQYFWGQRDYQRKDVETISFQGSLDGVPQNTWDVSENKDGSVMAWMENGNLHVAAEGNIAPNPDASWMFAYFVNLTRINFGNCFDTSNVVRMNYLFMECKSMASLDVSSFDTSNVTAMGLMFKGCSSLTSLGVSNFNTSNVTDMMGMFGDCSSLTSLDVSSFDSSKVIFMNKMFSGCNHLTLLDITDEKILSQYESNTGIIPIYLEKSIGFS